MNLEKEIFDIALQDIIPNRFQPREMFKESELQELAESIKQHGVIQPIIVRRVGDKYEIIAGERRFRASQIAGNKTIPALVRDIDDKETAKLALLENLQRSNLTPIEEAKTYQTILKLENITQEELATTLGKSQSTIANKLRLLSLTEEVQTALLNSQISERHARSLLGLNNSQQIEFLNRILNEKLTVRQLDEEIMRVTGKVPDTNIDEGIKYKGDVPMENDVINQEVSINTQSQVLNTTIPGVNNNQNSNSVVEIPSVPNVEIKENTNVTPTVGVPDIMNVVNNVQTTEQPVPEIPAVEPVVEQPVPEMPSVEPVAEQPVPEMPSVEPVAEQPVPEMPKVEPVVEQQTSNIFDKLRVNRDVNPLEDKFDEKTPDVMSVVEEKSTNNEDIYDLRFAINNFRQAIQNTEKFGFKVISNEQDVGDKYQITIEIEKK